jgi:hypothetical protein
MLLSSGIFFSANVTNVTFSQQCLQLLHVLFKTEGKGFSDGPFVLSRLLWDYIHTIQAVIRRFPTAAARVRARTCRVVFVVGRAALGQVSSATHSLH